MNNKLTIKEVFYSDVTIDTVTYHAIRAYEYWDTDSQGYEYNINSIILLICDTTQSIKADSSICLKRETPSSMRILADISEVENLQNSVRITFKFVDIA